MMRYILMAAMAIVTVAPSVHSAHAGGKSRNQSTRQASMKLCLATNPANKRVTWTCLSSQRCCWDAFTNSGSCASKSSGCF